MHIGKGKEQEGEASYLYVNVRHRFTEGQLQQPAIYQYNDACPGPTAASHEATAALSGLKLHQFAGSIAVVVGNEAYLGRYCAATATVGSLTTASCRF